MRYKKRPVVIDAIEWNGTMFAFEQIAQLNKGSDRKIEWGANGLVIGTLEGDMKAQIGDFIIRGVKGEMYPCAKDIFEQTYDPT